MKNSKLNNSTKTTKRYSLTIGWLYPRLMSTYGDRGNIIILKNRLVRRGIGAKIEEIHPGATKQKILSCDLIFMGGAQDAQQEIVEQDLLKNTGKVIFQMVENGTPALLVCGGYQFLGLYYMTASGKKIKGLGLLPLVTRNPGKEKRRLIGNVVIRPQLPNFPRDAFIVGFENHGGRTYLTDSSDAFAHVVKGSGNNGEDGTEGVVYKNAIGTYLHGPILSKSPELADYILRKALAKKYGNEMDLHPLDDKYAYTARNELVKKWYLSI